MGSLVWRTVFSWVLIYYQKQLDNAMVREYYPPMILDQDDIHSAALCAYKEARGDGSTGMHAVLHCLKNRVGAVGFPYTLHNVIYGKNQFTSMSVPSDPEFNLQPPPASSSSTDSALWSAAQELAGIVFTTDDADPTGGARYYANLSTANSGWFSRVISGSDGKGTSDHPMTVKIDHHTFYL